MPTFERYQDMFPVAAATLRSRGNGTEAARLGHLIGSSTRPLPMRRVSLLDVIPAWAMAAGDADALQPIVAAADPPTGIAWHEAGGPGAGGYGALCHSPEPGRLDVEHVELGPDGQARTLRMFASRLPGGHRPLDRAAVERLARRVIGSTDEGRRRMDAWLAGSFAFSLYGGMPETTAETDGDDQHACALLLTDLVVDAMLVAGVIRPQATVTLG